MSVKTHQSQRWEAGFTLVELMVVVAIIGILSSIAIPIYDGYVARSREREAQIQLGFLHTAMRNFATEWRGFTTCISHISYTPEPQGWYRLGFGSNIGVFVPTDYTPIPTATECQRFVVGGNFNEFELSSTVLGQTAFSQTAQTYQIRAEATLRGPGRTYNIWALDETGRIWQVTPGGLPPNGGNGSQNNDNNNPGG